MSGEAITVPPKPVDLRERQAAYRDWLDRERQRAALTGAECGKCVFLRAGHCYHSSSLVHADTQTGESVAVFPSYRSPHEWCEHYLPRAEHDPRPEGGTP